MRTVWIRNSLKRVAEGGQVYEIGSDADNMT